MAENTPSDKQNTLPLTGKLYCCHCYDEKNRETLICEINNEHPWAPFLFNNYFQVGITDPGLTNTVFLSDHEVTWEGEHSKPYSFHCKVCSHQLGVFFRTLKHGLQPSLSNSAVYFEPLGGEEEEGGQPHPRRVQVQRKGTRTSPITSTHRKFVHLMYYRPYLCKHPVPIMEGIKNNQQSIPSDGVTLLLNYMESSRPLDEEMHKAVLRELINVYEKSLNLYEVIDAYETLSVTEWIHEVIAKLQFYFRLLHKQTNNSSTEIIRREKSDKIEVRLDFMVESQKLLEEFKEDLIRKYPPKEGTFLQSKRIFYTRHVGSNSRRYDVTKFPTGLSYELKKDNGKWNTDRTPIKTTTIKRNPRPPRGEKKNTRKR